MEKEFEDYWRDHKDTLILHAPKALLQERQRNTKMNTPSDWLLFILPIIVMLGFYDSHFIENNVVNGIVTVVLGIIAFAVSELLKPYVTKKRSLEEIDEDIKQYFYAVYQEKGLAHIKQLLAVSR